MKDTNLIRIISLAYNLIDKSKGQNFIIYDEEITINLRKDDWSASPHSINFFLNGGSLFSLYLSDHFSWGLFSIDHLELMDLYQMDDTSIILTFSKKVLDHNLSSDWFPFIDTKIYTRIINLLSDKLQTL